MKNKQRAPSEENCLKKLDPDMRAIARWLVHSGHADWTNLAKLSKRSRDYDYAREVAIMANDQLPIPAKNMVCKVALNPDMDWTKFDPDSEAGTKLLSSGCVTRDGSSYRIPDGYLRCILWLYELRGQKPMIPRYVILEDDENTALIGNGRDTLDM